MRAARGHASRPRSSSGPGPSSTRPSGRSRTSSTPSRPPARRRPGARPPRRGRWRAPSTRARRRCAGTASRPSSWSRPSSPRTSSPWRSSTGSARRPSSTTRSSSSQIVFDDTKGPGVPKGRFAYIFPNKNSALIQVRFRSDLSESERDRAIGLVRQAVAMPEWKLPNGKGTYVVTGAPVVVSDLTRSISHSLIALLVAALRRHGAHAGPGLPRAAAAAAARRRPGRGRADLRRALAGRGVADHGLDRRAARCSSASPSTTRSSCRRGCRRPGRRGGHRGGGAAHGRARRPDGRDRRARRRRPASSCSRSRRCRWSAASGCCSWQASRSRCGCALTLGVAALARRARGAARAAAGVRGARRRRGAAPAS